MMSLWMSLVLSSPPGGEDRGRSDHLTIKLLTKKPSYIRIFECLTICSANFSLAVLRKTPREKTILVTCSLKKNKSSTFSVLRFTTLGQVIHERLQSQPIRHQYRLHLRFACAETSSLLALSANVAVGLCRPNQVNYQSYDPVSVQICLRVVSFPPIM